ncbi:MAG: M28 family peptidase [Solirubrobacteraceae bacterium]|nr:M28 family peptidase [Solirubrobacteraceae bacterium]
MEPDRELIESAIRHLASIERGSASEGEREAAEWIAARLREEGLEPSVDGHPAHGGYWWPLGVACAVAGAAGLAAGRGGRRRRALAALAAGASAAAIWDDLVIWRHWTRRLAGRRRRTWNVVAEAGDRSAARTLVVVAHHDAAHAGAIFDPRLPDAIDAAAPWVFQKLDTSPPLMWLVFGGPLLVAAGAASGRRRLRRAGTALSLACAAAFADIGLRGVVPGANDNLSGVAVVLALARRLREEPVDGLRVLLVSTGGEEAFEEGMQGFARDWWPRLPRETTDVLVVDTVGSPHLTLPEREGMLRPYRYDPGLKDTVERAAREVGVEIRRGLKFSFGSDALIGVRDGYRTALMGSVNHRKEPSNYHWPTDHADNVVYETVVDAAKVVERTARILARDG